MRPWKLLGKVRFPGSGSEMRLYERGGEFTLWLDKSVVMNSRLHASEDALASIVCARLKGRPRPKILIGGLGMGYTLAAALRGLGPGARVVVAELVPEVVEWNREHLGALAGNPMEDERTSVLVADVGRIIREAEGSYDAILLDVDNSPESLARDANDGIYSEAGLRAAHRALRPEGMFAVWSARPSRRFTKSLRKAGFEPEEVPARARDRHRGGHHLIWIAARRA